MNAPFIKVFKHGVSCLDSMPKYFNLLKEEAVKDLDKYPKSITKAIRYIKQDAPIEQLEEIRNLVNYAIWKRKLKSE